MNAGIGGAAAAAVLLFVALVAGCGLGPGKELGIVSLTVTRNFGAEQVARPSSQAISEADTVMRVLERGAQIQTSYGGGFVDSIEGLGADEGATGGPADWFFYVNGVESNIGAADYSLHGGEAIWWDYHDWSQAMRVPAVVGSWPQPFRSGYEGTDHPVSVDCLGGGEGCDIARERLRAAGVSLTEGAPPEAIRILVGPWAQLRSDPAAAQIGNGPQVSGVFADLEAGNRCQLQGLDESGHSARTLGADAGLVAATRRYEAPPTWVITGCDQRAVQTAANLLDVADLRDHFAVLAEAGGAPLPLPLPSR